METRFRYPLNCVLIIIGKWQRSVRCVGVEVGPLRAWLRCHTRSACRVFQLGLVIHLPSCALDSGASPFMCAASSLQFLPEINPNNSNATRVFVHVLLHFKKSSCPRAGNPLPPHLPRRFCMAKGEPWQVCNPRIYGSTAQAEDAQRNSKKNPALGSKEVWTFIFNHKPLNC